ncbi:hypothetical protein DdX_16674 [Ditylenchus destructor]|uniref:Uncharacterized protein n=1 Tax=Ditylenchus destructor TaxID=166010 RepID=A0AAD4QZV2_9BILA|nr:hypothetical protein DdX_16674 [Ditylenchus destructor]
MDSLSQLLSTAQSSAGPASVCVSQPVARSLGKQFVCSFSHVCQLSSPHNIPSQDGQKEARWSLAKEKYAFYCAMKRRSRIFDLI